MISGHDIAVIARMQRQKWHQRIFSKAALLRYDQPLKATFKKNTISATDKLDTLTKYFWQGQQHYLHTTSTLAYYPGYGSIYGARNDGIEGVTRLLPLWAAYTSSPDADSAIATVMIEHLKRALLNGTAPEHNGYWGDVGDKSTLICEAGDIALALWLARDQLWPSLSVDQQTQILVWLKQTVHKQTADNNWHLFVILVDLVICSLDTHHRFQSSERYARIKTFYLGDGCFKDGENGEVDLYNAWAFHYSLYWINQIDPDFDPRFIEQAIEDYCAWFQYLITERGVVLYGRSLCYRMAATVPLQIVTQINSSDYPAGMALHALYACWAFFIEQDGVQSGRPTQGVFEDNLLWLDPYSGPASGFWGTRSLVIHYYQSKNIQWKKIPFVALPAHERTVDIWVKPASLQLQTSPVEGNTKIIFPEHSLSCSNVAIQRQSIKEKIKGLVLATACRPANNLLKMKVKEFDSNLSNYRS